MSQARKLPTPKAWRQQREQEAGSILQRLPEIAAAQFTLHWDLETVVESDGNESRHWAVKCGEHVIYREPARYEDYHRFELLARLLKQKYGDRIRDLVPGEDPDTAYYLYGDFLGAVNRVEAARRRNFGK